MIKNANTLIPLHLYRHRRAQAGTSQGLAFTVVIVLSLLISLIGAGMLILANSHYKLTQHLIDSTKAFYLAEAGINRGLYIMRIQAFPTNETFSFEGTDIVIIFSGGFGFTNIITATVDVTTASGDVSRSIQVNATRSAIPPALTSVAIVSWQEL